MIACNLITPKSMTQPDGSDVICSWALYLFRMWIRIYMGSMIEMIAQNWISLVFIIISLDRNRLSSHPKHST
jgi:hypothetical protein